MQKWEGNVKLQVAVCDDEKIFRDELKKFLIEYKKEKRIQMDIYEFENGNNFLNSELVFDIVFLDFQMPGIDGLETAKKLRLKNFLCSIIFITSFPQFVYDSFEVQPFRFFLKPLDHEKLRSAMDSYFKQHNLMSPVIIVEDGEQIKIDSEKIIYLEGSGKYCLVRTKDNIFRSSKTISKVYELLPQHCFYRIHKSYVVNMYCILSVRGNEVSLINGEKAIIGRNHISEFKNVYKNFVKTFYLKV